MASNALLDYEPLRNPLNPKALQSLSRVLLSTGTLNALKAHLQHSATRLTECAVEVNDRNQGVQESVNRRREKGREVDELDERYARQLDERVRKCTEVLDEAMRDHVDLERGVGMLEEGIRDVNGEVVREGNMRGAVGSQMSQRQRERQRRRVVNENGEKEDDDEEDEEMEEIEKPPPTAPSGLLKEKLEEKRGAWERLSAKDRCVLYSRLTEL
jgi:hypothetical protein